MHSSCLLMTALSRSDLDAETAELVITCTAHNSVGSEQVASQNAITYTLMRVLDQAASVVGFFIPQVSGTVP